MSKNVLVPVVVNNAVPATSMVLAPDVVTLINTKVAELEAIAISDAATLAAKDAAFTALGSLRDAVEANRVAIKAPVLERGRLIDAAAKPALEHMDKVLAKAKGDTKAWNDIQTRKYEEAKRAAEAEARRKQAEQDEADRKEHQRLVDEAKAKHDAEVQAAQAKHAEEQRAAAELAEAMGELPPAPVAPPVVEPPKPVEQVALPARPVVQAAYVPPPAVSAAVGTVKRKVARAVDESLTPHAVNGIVLREYRVKDIERLLKANVAVPGWELREEESARSR